MEPAVEPTAVESGLDEYQGLSWSGRADLGPLRAGLDPYDSANRRNSHMDAVQRIALRWALARVTEMLGHRPARLLDFGCGAGRMLELLSHHADETWGTDRSVSMLDAAAAIGVVPRERLFSWDGTTAPLGIGVFDTVVTVGVTLTPTMLIATADGLRQLSATTACYVAIEQVDRRRQLTLVAYQDVLAQSGFDIVHHRLARRGIRSPAMAIAGRIPSTRPGSAALARLEWATAPWLGLPSDGYGDIAIVATRRRQSG